MVTLYQLEVLASQLPCALTPEVCALDGFTAANNEGFFALTLKRRYARQRKGFFVNLQNKEFSMTPNGEETLRTEGFTNRPTR